MSVTVMNRSATTAYVVMLSCCLSAFCLAVWLTAAYYESSNDIRYTTPLGPSRIIQSLGYVGTESLMQALSKRDLVFLSSALVATGVFYGTRSQARSIPRFLTFMAQGIVLYWGWLGLLMIPYSIVEGIDGEWLGEHSPTMIVTGLWILCSLVVALWSIDPRRRPSHVV